MGRPPGIRPGFSLLGSKWRVAYAAYFILTTYKSNKHAQMIVFAAFVDGDISTKQLDIDLQRGKIKLKLRKHIETENANIRMSAPLNDGEGTFHDIKSFARQIKRISSHLQDGLSESDGQWLASTGAAWGMALLGKDHLTRQAGIDLLKFAATQGSVKAILPCWLERNTAS
jgi:hypothetical protein